MMILSRACVKRLVIMDEAIIEKTAAFADPFSLATMSGTKREAKYVIRVKYYFYTNDTKF